MKLSIVAASMLFILTSAFQVSGEDRFKIVYAARPYSICEQEPPFRQIRDRDTMTWLKRVKKEYSATGIKLIVDWSLFYNLNDRNTKATRHLLNTLEAIESEDLEIYVAVKLSSIPGFVVDRMKQDDFQLEHDRTIAKTPNHTPLMNFASENARKVMKTYYNDLLKVLNTYKSVIEVIPNFSWDAETEYPYQMVTGYSRPMIRAFRKYLKEKHGSISELHRAWRLTASEAERISDFDNIVPDRSWGIKENWFADFNAYHLPYGRLEWIDFKAAQLSDIVAYFKQLNKPYNFRMPIQIGCTFDSYIERRGWIDFTTLIEFSDGVRVADIAGREDSFDFHAAYISSILNYWIWRSGDRSKFMSFSTESNWPGYAGKSAGELSRSWKQQLIAFYERGADAHFVYGWSDHKNPNLLLDSRNSYKAWRNTLKEYKNKPIKRMDRFQDGAHFSSLQAAVTHGYDKNARSQILNASLMGPYQKGFEILTDYMLLATPEYANLFNKISFPAPKEVIAAEVNAVITSGKINESTVIESRPTTAAMQVFNPSVMQIAPEIQPRDTKPEENLARIWRTRSDLQRLFPQANKADRAEAGKIGWNPDKDFIDWCIQHGNKEYKEINISYSNWHSTATKLWEGDSQLQTEFPDGYHSVNQDGYTLLDYLVALGTGTSEEKYADFRNWPYAPSSN